jgi:iron complex outermembrane receptor protein
VTANISDHFRLVSGIRYTHDTKTLNGVSDSALLTCVANLGPNFCTNRGIPYSQSYDSLPASYVALLPGGVLPPLGTIFAPHVTSLGGPDTFKTSEYPQDQKATNSRVTYREAVEWDVTDTSMAYASFETGYRSGGFNASPTYPTYEPEYIDAYTLGIKNRLFDNHLQLNVEAFDWDYKNQQVNHVSLDPLTGSPANFTANVGSSKIKGAEVDAIALVTDTTLLSADIQYLDAVYSSYVYSAAYTVPPPPAPQVAASPLTGCPATKAPLPGFPGDYVWNVNCSGYTSYNSPKWTINLAVQQTVNLDSVQLPNYQVVLTADTQYKSKYDNGFAYLSDETVNAHWTSNAMIEFEPKDEGWSVSAFIRNIEGHRTPEFSTFGPLSNLSVATTSPPRTYGVKVSMKF